MVIIAFVVYSLFSPTYGVVNSVAKAFGAQPTQWYSDPKYWPWILIATHIWQTMGMNSIVYYAALVGIDRDILEAAGLDGASSFRKAWHIMVPHLASIIVILTILGIGGLFSGDFGLFYQVPKDIGMLYPATDIINTYTYRALTTGAMEKSAAMGLFQSLSGLVLVVATNAAVRRISPENSLF
jgi:putative aldouronate transport system permease protein